jgi:hypothetical protein
MSEPQDAAPPGLRSGGSEATREGGAIERPEASGGHG